MRYPNLSTFMADLRARRDLIEITEPVDAYLEIAEIHRRVIAAGGPALLFTNVKGKAFPVVTNLFGTKNRVDLAFGDGPKDLVRQIASVPEELLPPTASKLWKHRGLAGSLIKVGMRRTGRAPVMAHKIPHADLTALPALTSWEEDGGPFLTLPLVHTASNQAKPDNLGMYRVQIHDAQETGMHFQIGKGGGFHLYECEKENRPLPLNIYLGGPPAMILAAIAPLPENVPEVLLASLLMGARLGRAKWREAAPEPVAEAEFCLTGIVPPGVRRPEGPFGDHYGYYSLKHDYPVFRPSAIYHRKGAVFPATVVGKPRQEDFFLGDYLQELLIPLIPKVMPSVVDLWSYGETGYHALAGAVFKERYGRESLSAAFRILGEGQLALTKFLLGVDKPMDLRDFKKVLTHVLERTDIAKDLLVVSETSMDTLDYTGPAVNKGSKGVLLGLGEARRTLPRTAPSPSGPVRRCEVYSPGCLVIEVPGYADDRDIVRELASRPEFKDWPLLIAVDNAARTVQTDAAFLWTTFTRFEPAADIYAGSSKMERNKIVYGGPLLIDARMKPWYPKELFCDSATATLVNEKWNRYFPDGKVVMGDSDLGHVFKS